MPSWLLGKVTTFPGTSQRQNADALIPAFVLNRLSVPARSRCPTPPGAPAPQLLFEGPGGSLFTLWVQASFQFLRWLERSVSAPSLCSPPSCPAVAPSPEPPAARFYAATETYWFYLDISTAVCVPDVSFLGRGCVPSYVPTQCFTLQGHLTQWLPCPEDAPRQPRAPALLL